MDSQETVLNSLNDLWNTRECVWIENFPMASLGIQGDIVERGFAGMTADNLRGEVRTEFDKVLLNDGKTILNTADDAVRKFLIRGFEQKLPVHMAIGKAGEVIPELGQFFMKHLEPTLRRNFFLGLSPLATLWISASGHIYKRHCDLGDGLLIQLRGKKVVKTFDVPADYSKQVIFDHQFSIQPDPYPLPSREKILEEGQAIFIPRGMPHQVSVPEGEQSVSVTFHMSGLYSVINLCKELNQSIGDRLAFGLVAAASQPEKFSAKFFDPHAVFLNAKDQDSRSMPSPLKDELCGLLNGKTRELKERLPALLDEWWHNRITEKRRYFGKMRNTTDSLPPIREETQA